jgi:hypothetical protein
MNSVDFVRISEHIIFQALNLSDWEPVLLPQHVTASIG